MSWDGSILPRSPGYARRPGRTWAPPTSCTMRCSSWGPSRSRLAKGGLRTGTATSRRWCARGGTLGAAGGLWVAAERLPMLEAVFPGAVCTPPLAVPERERAQVWTRESAVRELVRGRLEVAGPTTAAEIAGALGLPAAEVEFALGALEHEGFVLRGR